MREPPLWSTLRKLGAVKRGDDFILDGFDSEFYLRFDVAIDQDNPKPRTCDVYAVTVMDASGIRLLRDARESHVLRFMFALGISRFSEATREAAFAMNNIVRASERQPKEPSQ